MISFLKKKKTDNNVDGEEEVKKTKKKKEPKIPKRKIFEGREIKISKIRIQKIVSWTIILLIITSLVFNVIFFSKYNSISQSVAGQQEEISAELDRVSDNEIYSSDKSIYYAQNFLDDYMNIPFDSDDRSQLFSELSEYFYNGFEMNDLMNINDFNGIRQLRNADYIERTVDENRVINLLFEVDYLVYNTLDYETEQINEMEEEIREEIEDDEETMSEIEAEVSEELEEDVEEEVLDESVESEVNERIKLQLESDLKSEIEAEEHTTLIKIPLQAVNESYAIIDNPREVNQQYHSNLSEEDVIRNQYDGEELTQSEVSDLNTVFEDFFTAFALDDENIRLVSNYDTGIGNKELVEFDVIEAYSYQEDNQEKVISEIDVQYQDENSNLITTSKYEVTLIYYDGRFIVDEIN